MGAATPESLRAYKAGHFVASKRHRCWTRLLVCSLGGVACSVVPVADVGPAHADLDLHVDLARLIHHDGERIAWMEVGW